MASSGSNSSSSLTTMAPTVSGFEDSITPICTLRKEHTNSSISSGDSETSIFPSLASPFSHQMDVTTPSPPNVAFEVPQWKRDLIQRRKINMAKTITAAAENSSKEDIIAHHHYYVTSTTDTLNTSTTTCDSKNALLFANNNSAKLLLQSSGINSHNDTNKRNTSQTSITSSATSNNTLKNPSILQQQKVKIELLCGGHSTQINNKSSAADSLHNHPDKLSAKSASIIQSEQQQSPIPASRPIVGFIERKSDHGSSLPFPQENVRFRKNLAEQRVSTSTNTAASDSLLTSTARSSSSLKLAAEAEFYKKNNNDHTSNALCVSGEQQNSHIFQQKPDLTTSMSKGNKNDNSDGQHSEGDYKYHQLSSRRESDSLVCVVGLNEVDAREIDSIFFSAEHKTNGNNLISSLKPVDVINQRPCASVRPTSSHFIKNQSIDNINVVSTNHNYKKNNPKVRSNQNTCFTLPIAANNKSPAKGTDTTKMVALQDMNELTNNALGPDPSEELQYGPGIVSKLRCRYLSLAMRQCTGKQRLSMDSLRRATSLNNLLDNNGVHEEDDDEDDREDNINKETNMILVARSETSFSMNAKEAFGFKENKQINPSEIITCHTGLSYLNQHRSRHIKRGNDCLKRARSVEALLCEKSTWNFSNSQLGMVTNYAMDLVTIEDKITNARERLLSGFDNHHPKRPTSIIDDTERPPPDLVKQTLKIFEASANRKSRSVNRSCGGEVATKVANYKSIMTQNKSSFLKTPVIPKKANQKLKPISPEIKNNIISTPTSPTLASSESQADKIQSPLIPTPTTSNYSSITKSIRSKMDSTLIKNVGSVSKILEDLSENSDEDFIPQHNLFDKTIMVIDSPVTEITKSIEKLRIESPTSTTQTYWQQLSAHRDRHSRFSSESSERESEDDNGSIDGEYVVNIEESSSTKRISKLPLESIAKSGTSQKFIFSRKNSASVSNENSSFSEPLHDIPTLTLPNSATTTIKQIGVIRPLLAEPPQQQLKNNCIEEMSNNQSTLTSREIEKNRINNEKKVELSARNNLMEKISTSVIISKLKKIDIGESEGEGGRPCAIIPRRKKTVAGTLPENNTMIFNFKDRKEVPDYIENDGIIFKHKRELPKPNESGFVLLGDLSLETSTDPDDEWPTCPPSPCDVEFENAHIIIDGKSNIKSRPKEAIFRVQFNDTLISTFEYPSESFAIEESGSEYTDYSSLDELGASTSPYGASPNESRLDMEAPIIHHHVKSEEIIQLPQNNKVLGNLALGSAPLGSYTPITSRTENIFQLGVTRAPNSQLDKTGDDPHSDENLQVDYNVELNKPSLDCLKPASDDLTIAYSEGSLKTDLLY